MDIDILIISELKWTGMGEFNSDDHYIYYCGQESLRRNGVGDECLSPRVRLECNPEIPVAPGEEHWLLDTSLDEVYWPCSHSRAMPSFPSQLEWKIGLAWANTRGSLNSPS